jgi:uncharacterized protein (TIRG00374 family)
MKGGLALPLIVALLSQLGKYFVQSFAFSNSFKTVGEKITAKHTINLVFGMFFVNTIAPSVGTSGIMLVVDDARKRGIPAGRATSAAILMQISIETGFLVIMTLGFLILQITGTLDPVWLGFGLIVLVLILFMASILVIGRKRPNVMLKFFGLFERLANKVLAKFKKDPKSWSESLVGHLGNAAGRIAHNPKQASKVFLFSILASMCELGCFILCGLAFGVQVLPALIGGYVVATLFAMISFTPQGVGIVEAAVVILMTSFGISPATATAIAIVYRGLVFWMPFAVGAILINKTKTFSGKKDT